MTHVVARNVLPETEITYRPRDLSRLEMVPLPSWGNNSFLPGLPCPGVLSLLHNDAITQHPSCHGDLTAPGNEWAGGGDTGAWKKGSLHLKYSTYPNLQVFRTRDKKYCPTPMHPQGGCLAQRCSVPTECMDCRVTLPYPCFNAEIELVTQFPHAFQRHTKSPAELFVRPFPGLQNHLPVVDRMTPSPKERPGSPPDDWHVFPTSLVTEQAVSFKRLLC